MIGGMILSALMLVSSVMSSMDPAATKRKEAKGKSKAALEKLGLTEPLDLSEHEQVLMSEVIAAEDIPSGFSGKSS